MALDAVELVLDIEEAFAISIPDEDAASMLTVGDVYAYLLKHTADMSSQTCLTSAVFYDLRRQLSSACNSRVAIRPKSKLSNVIPLQMRRRYWNKLSSAMDVNFPRLVRPSWITLINIINVSVITYAAFLSVAAVDVAYAIFAVTIVGVLASLVLYFLTQPLALLTSSKCNTVRDLVTSIVALNYHKLASRYATRHQTDVWNILRDIIVQQLDVDPSAVVPQASFVRDLGLQ